MIESFYDEIKESLPLSRKAFVKVGSLDDEASLRSESEAKLILQTIKQMAILYGDLVKEDHSLKSIFEKDFGDDSFFYDRETILEICFIDDFLFPLGESFPFDLDSLVSEELLINYYDSFKDWCIETKQKHDKTQKLLLESFDIELKQKNLDCSCLKCVADYRAKLRDTIFTNQVNEINRSEEKLHDLVLTEDIAYLCDYTQKLKKRVEKEIQKIRYRLKRGSLNKLNSDVKAHFKLKFSYSSELGKVYKERLITFFNGILEEGGHKTDFISEAEYERFFIQLGVNIWKSPSFLKREFETLVRAVTSYKRKDISASILRDYLGQFWVHSSARRKNRKVIYHMGPTNSGKTWNAIEALSKAKNGCYLAPLRLLASELYDTLNEKGAKTTLLTGEEVIETSGATHYSSTIEMAKLNEEFECAVIDEIQMITDPQRGWAWTRALVNINADEVHLCGDHSVLELVEKILKLTGDTLEVNSYERKTKLKVLDAPIKLVELEKNDALIVFSRRNALKFKRDLENLNFKVSIVYGRLSPEVRREQARKFDEEETDIMVSTDAIAMGMNLPVKRIVFSTLSKFFDSKEHPITNSEIKQIAGRAGRFGRFPEGFVTTLKSVEDGMERLEEALSYNLEQSELAMVGPDLEIFRSVNQALSDHSLPTLRLSEFLRLFNTMTFEKPFYCVDLKEMIEVTEMVEGADEEGVLSDSEVFGFACAPVNLGLVEHVQYYVWILNHYVKASPIINEEVDIESDDIDYLERAIKCVELYQWLARHFQNKHFSFDHDNLLENKSFAVEKLNQLLSEKVAKKCSSCGVKLEESFDFNICESCFSTRRARFKRKPQLASRKKASKGKAKGKGKFKPKAKKNKAAAFKRGR